MSALRVWLKDGYTVEVISRLAHEFTDETGIELAITVVDEVTAHGAFVHAAADERPDVTTVPFWYLAEYADAGYLRPLSDSSIEVDLDAYHPAAVEAMTVAGQPWAVPHTLIGGMLAVRRDLLDPCGAQLPSTPAEALEILGEVGAALDLPSLLVRSAADFPSFGTFAGWAWAEGVRLLDATAVDAARVLRPLVVHLREHGAADAADLDYVAAGDRFLRGHALALFDTTGWGNYIEDPARSAVAGRVETTVLRGTHAAAQFLYSEGLAVTSWSPRAAEAEALISWRHRADILQRELLEQHRFDHPRRDVRATEPARTHAETRGVASYLATLEDAWDAIEVSYFPRRADFVARGRAVATAVSAAVAGRADLTDGLRQAGLS